MRLGKCVVDNFCSYEHLEFDFSNTGLSLIYGPTGAGKSTLPDVPCWIMFGQTAKDGSADDVRSWKSPNALTKGTLDVTLQDTTITITRIRGKANENDLYWTEKQTGDALNRGKDLSDTQNLLEGRLGVSSDMYITASYFHEFSPTGSFFSAKAKDRRSIFERIAAVDLSTRLGSASALAKKEGKSLLQRRLLVHSDIVGRIEGLRIAKDSALKEFEAWPKKQEGVIQALQVSYDSFGAEKAAKVSRLRTRFDRFQLDKDKKIEDLSENLAGFEEKIVDESVFDKKEKSINKILSSLASEKCPTCGTPKPAPDEEHYEEKLKSIYKERIQNAFLIDKAVNLAEHITLIKNSVNPYIEQLTDAENLVNQYGEQLEAERTRKNPHAAQLTVMKEEILKLCSKLASLSEEIEALDHRLCSLNQLYDLSSVLRGELLKKSVQEIETNTNRILETYFDGELRVGFSLSDSDDLDATIQKNGYDCNYKQLSKGQRALLKLAFSLSIMEAASLKTGVHFEIIFLDEALDGLDSDLKVKAFNLLEELCLNHQGVMVIDHSPEFHQLFSNRYKVALVNDCSEIELESE